MLKCKLLVIIKEFGMPRNALYYFVKEEWLADRIDEADMFSLLEQAGDGTIKRNTVLVISEASYQVTWAIYKKTALDPEEGRQVVYFEEVPKNLKKAAKKHVADLKHWHLSIDHNGSSHCTIEHISPIGEKIIGRVYCDPFANVELVTLKRYVNGEEIRIVDDPELEALIIQQAKPGIDLLHQIIEKKWKAVLSLEKKLKEQDTDIAMSRQGVEELSLDILHEKRRETQSKIEDALETIQSIDLYHDFGQKDPRGKNFQGQRDAIIKGLAAKPVKSRKSAIEEPSLAEEVISVARAAPAVLPTISPLVSLKEELKQRGKVLSEEIKKLKRKKLTTNHLIQFDNLVRELTETLLELLFSGETFTKEDKDWIGVKESSIANNKKMISQNVLVLFQEALLMGNLEEVKVLLPYAVDADAVQLRNEDESYEMDESPIVSCFEYLFNAMGGDFGEESIKNIDEELASKYIEMGRYLYDNSACYRDFVVSANEEVNENIRYLIDQRRYVENLLFMLIKESSMNAEYAPAIIIQLLKQVDLKTQCLALVNLFILPQTDRCHEIEFSVLTGMGGKAFIPGFFSTESDYNKGVLKRRSLSVSDESKISLLFYNKKTPCGIFDIAPSILQKIVKGLIPLTLGEQRKLLNDFLLNRSAQMSQEFNFTVYLVAQIINSVTVGRFNEIEDCETMVKLFILRGRSEILAQLSNGFKFYALALKMLATFVEKFEGQKHDLIDLYTKLVKENPAWIRECLVGKFLTAAEISVIRGCAPVIDEAKAGSGIARIAASMYTPIKNEEKSGEKSPKDSPDTVADIYSVGGNKSEPTQFIK